MFNHFYHYICFQSPTANSVKFYRPILPEVHPINYNFLSIAFLYNPLEIHYFHIQTHRSSLQYNKAKLNLLIDISDCTNLPIVKRSCCRHRALPQRCCRHQALSQRCARHQTLSQRWWQWDQRVRHLWQGVQAQAPPEASSGLRVWR